MTLNQYLVPLKRQWALLVLVAVGVMAGTAAYTFTREPIYAATSTLYVTVSNAQSDAQELNQGANAASAKVKTYAEIPTITSVLRAVIAELELPYTVGDLRGVIEVRTPVDTTLLAVEARDADPQRAAAIAQAVADQVPLVVRRMETPEGSRVSPVKVQTLQAAEVPTSPISPRVPLNLAVGVILGLGLGVATAFLRDQLNTTITSVADIEAITGAVPLGVMPFDRAAATQPLADANDTSGRAEAYRSLRTNLQFTNVDQPPRVVVVTSGLPEEGKSTTACNLALTLALNGSSTVLIGGDLRKPSLSRYLGISSAVGLTSVLVGQYTLQEALVPFMGGKLAVLPSGPTPPNPSELLNSAQMRKIVTVLSDKFEYVVIDAPPVLPVTDGALLAALADGALVVTRHGRTTRETLQRTLQALDIVNARVLGTVINFAPPKRGSGYEGYGYGAAPPERAVRHGHGASPRLPSTAGPKAGPGPAKARAGGRAVSAPRDWS